MGNGVELEVMIIVILDNVRKSSEQQDCVSFILW